jgi:branched-subunit amino acid aminotransferase/4-amino-4-deoxychorismate lyase
MYIMSICRWSSVVIVPLPRIEIDGGPAGPADVYATLLRLGHFTAAQLRGGAIRGLDVHLDRLDGATRELFGVPLPGQRVRAHIRHALAGDVTDASVRVYVCQPEGGADVSVAVVVNPPAQMPAGPQRLKSVNYLRPLPHIKQVGAFAHAFHRRAAIHAGYDDALLTGPDSEISESGICNVGFSDGTGIVWPATPHLVGTTMRLLDRGLARRGVPVRRELVRLADLAGFRGAFVANSGGLAAVSQVDGLPVPVDEDLMKTLTEVFESTPWDPV